MLKATAINTLLQLKIKFQFPWEFVDTQGRRFVCGSKRRYALVRPWMQ